MVSDKDLLMEWVKIIKIGIKKIRSIDMVSVHLKRLIKSLKRWAAEWENYQSNLNNLIQDIANSMDKNEYNSKKVQKLIFKHFKLVGTLNPTNKESYIELANLYCEHEDFIVFFDNYHKGLAQFMSKAMIYFANNNSRN